MTWTQIAILLVAGIAIAECLTCSTDADCTAREGDNSECKILEPCMQGTCVCMDGYQSTSGTCEAEIAIDAACTAWSECGDNAECTGSVCACTTAYSKESNGVDCELTNTNVAYGDACTEDDECATSGASCIRNVCACGDAYGFGYTGSKCFARTHGDACSSSEPCLSGVGLTCGSSDECECADPTNQTIVSLNFMGFAMKVCFHNEASYNLGKGEKCNNDDVELASALACKTSLTCGKCPEDTNTKICRESGASNFAASYTILFVTISALVVNFV